MTTYETARKRIYHDLARDRKEPVRAEWLEQLCAHVEEGHPIGEAAAKDLLCEVIRLQFDLACRDGGVGFAYEIREALGFNKLYPFDHLPADARRMRAALQEAISFQADDTQCLMGRDPEEGEQCVDGRCKDHGCMVERVNRWRAAVAT